MIRNLLSKLNLMKGPRHQSSNLGRWALSHDNKEQNLKSTYANRDHCGDLICGDPKHLKTILDGTWKETINENVSNTKVNVSS